MKTKTIVIGAGGHAKVVIDCMEQEGKHLIEVVVDDNFENRFCYNFKVENKALFGKNSTDFAIIAIGNCATRKRIAQEFKANFITTIHPSAIISKYAQIGEGSQIFAGAIVNASAVVGNHVIINTAAVVEHDCVIEDFVHLSPNCCLGGEVRIGSGTHVGIGATIIQGVNVGKNVVIGAGAVVISDIPDNCTAVGIPAKPIKYHHAK